MTPAQVEAGLGVDPGAGLGSREAAERVAVHGPNQLTEPARRPEWLKFLDQFRNWSGVPGAAWKRCVGGWCRAPGFAVTVWSR
ncbi:cation-transporting P-type ATPase [Streptomyces sp. NPDC057253]|uniref:cation-transporting P-type ATPase n=1 Tax=Streptomyces sp. NPDC057253 TaxID=3346069 RepID=UPI003636FF9C